MEQRCSLVVEREAFAGRLLAAPRLGLRDRHRGQVPHLVPGCQRADQLDKTGGVGQDRVGRVDDVSSCPGDPAHAWLTAMAPGWVRIAATCSSTCCAAWSTKSSPRSNGLDVMHHAAKWARFHGKSIAALLVGVHDADHLMDGGCIGEGEERGS